jgi:5-methyltetrahydropteroyltriglutamate--homocysteine methyltransferase
MGRLLLQTTIAGSLPKPAWLAQPNQLWAPWVPEGESLAEAKRDATRLAIRDQERAGIDILTDGEQSRRHFVTGYLEHLNGIDFERLVTMRIRRRYDASVPQVVGPIARPRPVHSDDVRLMRAETDHPIKYTLPGPMTIIDTLHDAYYKDRSRLALAFAKILNQEARELEALGANVIQFDEPAFNVYMDEVKT